MTALPITIEIADETGHRVGSVDNVTGLRIRKLRNKALTCSGTLDVPADRDIARLFEEHKSRLIVYLGDELLGHLLLGRCIDVVDEETETIAFESADPQNSPLGRREVQAQASYAAVDQGTIVKDRIDTQNARDDTFVATSTYSFVTGTTRTLTVDVGKPETQIIDEFCLAYGGIDFEIIPVQTDDDPIMGQARVWANRGSILENVAFECGEGGNRTVAGFRVVNDPSKLTTHQRVPGKDGAVATAVNAATQTEYGTIFDSTDALADVGSQTLLDAACQQIAAWRTGPRRIVEITPAGVSWLPLRDFEVADYLPIALEGSRYVGDDMIVGAVRCHGWEMTRDAAGNAVLSSLVLLPDDQGGA